MKPAAPMEPAALVEQLENDDLYQQWKKQHPQSYLSHFFCQMDNQCQIKGVWETGFFDPATEKITIFAPLQKGFEIKPADDVFKKEADVVEKLSMEKVAVSFGHACDTCRQRLRESYAQVPFGDGFIILQSLQCPLWNFTFITKTLQFLNIKINAETGEVLSGGMITVVEQQRGEKSEKSFQ